MLILRVYIPLKYFSNLYTLAISNRLYIQEFLDAYFESFTSNKFKWSIYILNLFFKLSWCFSLIFTVTFSKIPTIFITFSLKLLLTLLCHKIAYCKQVINWIFPREYLFCLEFFFQDSWNILLFLRLKIYKSFLIRHWQKI